MLRNYFAKACVKLFITNRHKETPCIKAWFTHVNSSRQRRPLKSNTYMSKLALRAFDSNLRWRLHFKHACFENFVGLTLSVSMLHISTKAVLGKIVTVPKYTISSLWIRVKTFFIGKTKINK